MALELRYDTKDDVPAAFLELYTEKEGKWDLTGITGMKTQADIDRMQVGLDKERDAHKETKTKLKGFEGVDLEQHTKDQDELVTLRAKVEAGAGSDFDQEKFDAAVDKLATARATTSTAPLERELTKMTEERDTLATENVTFKTNETNRTISDSVRRAAAGIKVIDTAMDDVLMLGERVFEIAEDGTVLTRDNVGVTAGIAPDIWLAEMQDKRPHWWPVSAGGGATGDGSGAGGFAKNPFSDAHWNLTGQGAAMRENRATAERMATAAGTTIGGGRPAPKVAAGAAAAT